MRRRFSFHRRLFPYVLLGAAVGVVLAALLGTTASARSTVQTAPPSQASQGECTSRICTFDLQVNPGLQPGKPFACPAIQNARARITITNRFVTGAQNDIMVLTAKGLPKNTGFDMFLVSSIQSIPTTWASGSTRQRRRPRSVPVQHLPRRPSTANRTQGCWR